MPSNFRYDPLYRVIDETKWLQIIEGSYRWIFRRLKEINNLGIIPRVFEMAKYPKYEHSVGTLHQVQNLIDLADEAVIREKYRSPLLISAVFLHTGHLPFTYSTERSLLLASNLGERTEKNKIEKYVRSRIDPVFDSLELEESLRDKELKRLLEIRDSSSLYRFFSAHLLIQRWDALKAKSDELSDDDLQIIIRNLIDRSNDGYRYLDLANRADYVQRDALYFGTVRIDISPKHLYGEMSEYAPNFSISEEKLIEANLEYLKSRFYENTEVIGYSRLYEKIVASMILSTNFKIKWLEEYDDAQFERLITLNRDKGNEPAKLPSNWVKRAKNLLDPSKDFQFVHICSFPNVPYGKNAIDVEYDLIGKSPSKRGLLKYPYDEGILLSVEFDSEGQGSPLSRKRFEVHTIRLFQRTDTQSIVPLLNVVKKLSPFLSFSNVSKIRRSIARQLASTDTVRFEDEAIAVNIQVVNAIAKAIERIQDENERFIPKFFSGLNDLKSWRSIWRSPGNGFWLVARGSLPFQNEDALDTREPQYRGVAKGILSLPTELLRFSKPSDSLQSIKKELIQMIGEDEIEGECKRGDLFEAACLLDRILNSEGQFHLFINGMVVCDPKEGKGKRDVCEHDIIELRINEEGKSECWIYACSIADDYIAKDRDKITDMARHIHDNEFSELSIKTRHVIPQNKGNYEWDPSYENAGTNF